MTDTVASVDRPADPLRERRFVLFATARTISVFGNAMGPLALTFAVLDLPGGSPTALSLVLAAISVPRIALMLLGGVIGDRLPRHRVLVAAELMCGTAYGAMTVLVLSGRAGVATLAVCAAVAGTASALLLPSLNGLTAELVAPQARQRGNALLRLGTNTATVAGFTAGGALITWLGPGWALALDAATFAVAALLLARLRLAATTRPAGRNLPAELRDGWREFVRRRWLWQIVLAAAVINAAVGVTFGLAGPLLARAHLGGAGAWSGVLAGYAVGMFAGVLVAMRIRTTRPLRTAVLAVSLLGLPALLLGAGAALPFVILAAVLAGVAFDVFGVLWETTVQSEVPTEAMSRVSAYEWLGAVGLGPPVMIAAGLVVPAIGVRTALLALATVIFVAALVPLASSTVRHYERQPDGRVR
ncbi:MFS transporter [Micromonospora sp. DT46]|uniref:MFS transporter n=1 Tax=unclassified Micromonospora TaxID=2617518 RepID=UPI00124B917B|nr:MULTISPECIES: MFS transporter [unclassified Micromonospora]KAB1153519.1 MFS transporter [Micromonospora sp. AMSO12t]WSG04116.1 MFS transporter [Micromonospora sp. NBC_01740]